MKYIFCTICSILYIFFLPEILWRPMHFFYTGPSVVGILFFHRLWIYGAIGYILYVFVRLVKRLFPSRRYLIEMLLWFVEITANSSTFLFVV